MASSLSTKLTDIMIARWILSFSSMSILLCTTSIDFSCVSDPQTYLCRPKSGPTVSYLHHRTLASAKSRRYLQNVPFHNLFTSSSQLKIFGHIPTVEIIPESSSSFQDLVIHKKNFWHWACNLLNNIQLIIIFELLAKCLQNRHYHFESMCSTTESASQDSSNFSKKKQRKLFKVALQGYFNLQLPVKNQLFPEYIHSILTASSEHSMCIQVLSRSK